MSKISISPTMPKLSDIDFSTIPDIKRMVRERYRALFNSPDEDFIDAYIDTVENLFNGKFPEYQAMDTAYHDITHTLQATLCLVELIHNMAQSEAAPDITASDFQRAFVAILMHDIGFLKKAGDQKGTGAKYTHLHEQRSCEFARKLLHERGWVEHDILTVENLISSTGPRANLNEIEYQNDTERMLGQIVCTADYIGQMSDPQYPDRLKSLFNEFEESYRYQQIPVDDWPFRSYEALLRGTPDFWENLIQRKLDGQCAGVWRFLESPVTGDSPHIKSLRQNLNTIRERIARTDQAWAPSI